MHDTMTVRELIEQLSRYDPDYGVVIIQPDGNYTLPWPSTAREDFGPEGTVEHVAQRACEYGEASLTVIDRGVEHD